MSGILIFCNNRHLFKLIHFTRAFYADCIRKTQIKSLKIMKIMPQVLNTTVNMTAKVSRLTYTVCLCSFHCIGKLLHIAVECFESHAINRNFHLPLFVPRSNFLSRHLCHTFVLFSNPEDSISHQHIHPSLFSKFQKSNQN